VDFRQAMDRRALRVAEVATSFAVAGLFVLACRHIKVDPLDRLGQVSGLAAIAFRFMLAAFAIVVALVIAAGARGGRSFDVVGRFACAAIAGLASGFVAGGILVALRGTPWGLGGEIGDTGTMIDWANDLRNTGTWKGGIYPPLQIHLIAWFAQLDSNTSFAIKDFQVFGVAIMGPATYAAWRLLLRPPWALGIGVVAALPLIESYRPYPSLVLMVFIPIAIAFLHTLRGAESESNFRLASWGVGFGAVFGILFLLYSGWFFWSAPGFAIAAIILGPWRRAPGKCAVLCAVALVVFALCTMNYVNDVVHVKSIRDDYIPFDAIVDPMYIAMWRGGLPGKFVDLWPPIGELGGVGVFTLLLFTGFGVAIAAGRSRSVVVVSSLLMAGCWGFRLWFAEHMWQTKLVQLYTRTSYEIVYCLLILGGYAVYLLVERARARAPADSILRSNGPALGAICALLLLFASAGSSIADRYMPADKAGDQAWLAFKGQTEQHPTLGADVGVSSSHEADGFLKAHLTDRSASTFYESEPTSTDHDEWITLRFPLQRSISKVVLYPAHDAFPVDFTIDVWDTSWVTRVSKTSYSPQPRGPQVFDFGRTDVTTAVRIHVTKLAQTDVGYLYQLGEIQLIR
jgi:hypothetical protein